MAFMGAAAIIVNTTGEVLLVKHTYGKCNWEIPGGGAEAGESPVDTAIRAVREETGLSVRARHTTGCYFDQDNGSLHFVFRCDMVHETKQDAEQEAEQETQATPDGMEIAECGYWKPDALPRPISDFTLLRIRDALAGAEYPLPTTIGPRRWLE